MSHIHCPNRTLILLTLTAAISGFLFGYDTGIVSGAIIQIRENLQLKNIYQEIIISSTILSAAIFALLSSIFNDHLGRKPVIIFASLCFTLGAVVLASAQGIAQLIIGRLIVGIGVGLASMTVPIYIAECSTTQSRGSLVTLNNMLITFGQFVASVIAGIFSYDIKHGWRYMLGLSGIPSLIQMFLFIVLPESPRWLAAHGLEQESTHVFELLHGPEYNDFRCLTDHEGTSDSQSRNYKSMESSDVLEHTTPLIMNITDDSTLAPTNDSKLVKIFRNALLRRNLIVGCCLQLFQQIVGINTVMYYSASIISMAGINIKTSLDNNRDSIWLSTLVSLTNFIFSCVGVYLVSKFRRRNLVLSSLFGVLLSLLFLSLTFQLIATYSVPVSIVEPLLLQEDSCPLKKNCDSCIASSLCGYCYQLDARNTVINGSCLPSAGSFTTGSAYGRCKIASSTNQVIYAYNYCPSSFGWMAVIGLILYLSFFGVGMGPLPWTINVELYPTWARNIGVSLSTFVNWIANLIISLTFLTLTDTITRQGTYLLYASFSLIGLVFLAKFLPETSELSLEELETLR